MYLSQVCDNLMMVCTHDKSTKSYYQKITLKKYITMCLYAVTLCNEVYYACVRREHVLLLVKTLCTDTTESERMVAVYMHPGIKLLVLCTVTLAVILAMLMFMYTMALLALLV
jgi:hypothetical protein